MNYLAEKVAAIRNGDALVTKRYNGFEGDNVIGLIQDRTAEIYKIEIPNASVTGLLGILDFDGASQRNRPMLNPGDCVYCRVQRARPGLEMDLTCKEKHKNDAKGWMTKEARYGALPSSETSYLICCSTQHVKSLINEKTPLILALKQQFPHHKLKVGANGCCWINSATTIDTTIIANSIRNAASVPESQHASMLSKLIANVHAKATLATSIPPGFFVDGGLSTTEKDGGGKEANKRQKLLLRE